MVRRLIEVSGASSLDACRSLTSQMMSESEAREVAHVLDALSDPVRLRIFSLIASEGEVCSCNLEGPVAKSQPTVSHHTRILAGAGLIVGEKRGRWTYWRVEPGQLDKVAELLHSQIRRFARATCQTEGSDVVVRATLSQRAPRLA